MVSRWSHRLLMCSIITTISPAENLSVDAWPLTLLVRLVVVVAAAGQAEVAVLWVWL